MTPNYYRTSDLNFAAYLVASGCPLVGTEFIAPRKTVFVFDISAEKLEELEASWVGTGTIPARPYAETLKGLKGIVMRGF